MAVSPLHIHADSNHKLMKLEAYTCIYANVHACTLFFTLSILVGSLVNIYVVSDTQIFSLTIGLGQQLAKYYDLYIYIQTEDNFKVWG